MIYSVQSKKLSPINLWRVESGTFRIIEFGEFTSIMTGSDYTIVHSKLIPLFDELLSNEIEIKPVKIIRRTTSQEWNEYSELIIKEHIDPEKIKIVDENERDIWQYRHHIFISERMKDRFLREFENDFSFSEGFGHSG